MHLYAKIQKVLKYANAYADMQLHIIRCLFITLLLFLQMGAFVYACTMFTPLCNALRLWINVCACLSSIVVLLIIFTIKIRRK